MCFALLAFSKSLPGFYLSCFHFILRCLWIVFHTAITAVLASLMVLASATLFGLATTAVAIGSRIGEIWQNLRFI